MTSTALLPRMTDKMPVPAVPDFDTLANHFKQKLGYKGLKIHKERLIDIKQQNEFVNFLIDIGCAPYKAKDVVRYKKKKAFWENHRLYRVCHGFWYTALIFVALTITISPWLIFPTIAFFVVGCITCGQVSDNFRWRLTALDNYKEPIPLNILQKAIEIKEHYPDTSFHVDALEKRRLTRDPFLTVDLNNTRYYISVWDEPDFNLPHH